ncbi:MAG: DUF2142 domain-containing protein [Lachnospiraceae bacterium]|nr:DUF2142 domain-containing protein [Lachnospiraceae bacterium]
MHQNNPDKTGISQMLLLFLPVFVLLFLWSLVLPFGRSPDEEAHYLVAQYLFQNHRLPIGTEPELRIEGWGFSYAFQPYLSYMIAALNMRIVSLFTDNGYWLIIAARFVNVVMGSLMVVVVFQIACCLFEPKHIRLLFTLMVTLLPQNLFMHVYVNTDSMAVFSTSVIVLAWLKGLKNDWDLLSLSYLTSGLILCIMSYYNAYGFVLCSGILFIRSLIQTKNKPLLIKKALFVCIIVFFAVGWYFIRNAFYYDGDFLGLKIRNQYAELFADYEHKPSSAHTWKGAGFSVFYMLFRTGFLKLLCQSFIGMFGRMDKPLPNAAYIFWGCLYITGLLAFIGSISVSVLNQHVPKKEAVLSSKDDILFLHILFFFCIVIPLYLTIYRSYTVDYQPQGRYVLPALIPSSYFVCLGLEKMITNKKNTGYIICAGIIAITLHVYLHMVVIPYFGRLAAL